MILLSVIHFDNKKGGNSHHTMQVVAYDNPINNNYFYLRLI